MAIKKYPYAVKYNGVFYPANTEINVNEEKPTAKEQNAKETAVKKNDKPTGGKS